MTKVQQVPLVDLSSQQVAVDQVVREGFERVLKRGMFILGAEADQFENEFAAYSGVEHVLGVGNGTEAIELALRAGGIGAGDEVIVPTNTFVATAEAVVRAGARVRLVDCDEDFLIDPAAVAAALGPRVGAVVGVHLYGQAAPMETLREVIGNDVLLVEDAAQSHGATRHGVRCGGLADISGTSFYPGKNLGAYGDAGAVLTNSVSMADRVRAMRNHGGIRRYEHEVIGLNSRLDELQAVVLSAKLAHLDAWTQLRRDAARIYDELLEDVAGVVIPRVVAGNEHVFHLYVVRVPRRDDVIDRLALAGVAAAVHYPTPIHRLPAFAFLGLREGEFPMAERLSKEILSLPIFPGITPSQQEHVVAELQRALGS